MFSDVWLDELSVECVGSCVSWRFIEQVYTEVLQYVRQVHHLDEYFLSELPPSSSSRTCH